MTPVQDPQDSRRLRVSVSGPVNTYFARVLGLTSLNARRDSKADFVLPVPMGSPQNYYGVSALKGSTTTSVTNTVVTNHFDTTRNSGLDVATTAPAGTPWVTSSGSGTLFAAVASANSTYTQTKTNAATQQFGGFGLDGPMGSGESISGNITGLQVVLTGVSLSAACGGTNTISGCPVLEQRHQLDDGRGGDGEPDDDDREQLHLRNDVGDELLDRPHDLDRLGDQRHELPGQADGGEELRNGRDLHPRRSLQVHANYTTNTPTSVTTTTYTTNPDPTPRAIDDPATGTSLASQGFWGAVITKGGERGNGDRYSPAYNGDPAANAEYDPNGYDYTIEVGSSGRISIYDPTYCATGSNTLRRLLRHRRPLDRRAGTPVTTVFTLYGINSTPLDLTDDVQVATSGAMFVNEVAADYSGNYGQPAGWSGAGSGSYTNCGGQPVPQPVVVDGDRPRGGHLSAEREHQRRRQRLDERREHVVAVGVGRRQAARLRRRQDGGLQQPRGRLPDVLPGADRQGPRRQDDGRSSCSTRAMSAATARCASSARTGTPTTTPRSTTWPTTVAPARVSATIQTASGGSSFFNNSVLTIQIALPASYGSVGLTPAGETEAGWWKIEYTVGGGNDTTTWAVSIRGNPVHLVLP